MVYDILAGLPWPCKAQAEAKNWREFNFNNANSQKNSCIDQGLINKLCPDTSAQLSLLDVAAKKGTHLFTKDKGQRPACVCAPSKCIVSYRNHPCKRGCRYCNAGHAKNSANINRTGFRSCLSYPGGVFQQPHPGFLKILTVNWFSQTAECVLQACWPVPWPWLPFLPQPACRPGLASCHRYRQRRDRSCP